MSESDPAFVPGGSHRASRAWRRVASPHAAALALLVVGAGGCANAPTGMGDARNLPCAGATATALSPARTTVADCSNGGTTTTLAGNGASYLIVAQLPADQGKTSPVGYDLVADTTTAPAVAANLALPSAGTLPVPAPNLQAELDYRLQRRERAAAFRASPGTMLHASRAPAATSIPALGTVRTFHVLTDYTSTSDVWTSVTAQLAYVGSDLLLYVDTRTPDAGFSPDALAQFGRYFDQILYPIDTTAFGPPTDVDGNGHVIMLMSPAVNAGTPRAICSSQSYVAGFFNGEDFNAASDPNSNQGEIFYSIVADPQGTYGCAHTVAEMNSLEPGVFLHELQHLISYAQHVVVEGGKPADGWLDEGMSLVAEELGSKYYEAKCPPPACRSVPDQLLPDSSEGFARNFMLDSYKYATNPDTVSITQSSDGSLGLAWRGGAWALMRWLGDHMPSGFYRRLETTQGSGPAAIESASGGQDFASLFANFGLALYTDSLPGMPRNTVPVADRFNSRNTRQLWAQLLSPSPSQALPFPIPVHRVTSWPVLHHLMPGGMAFWRLDTPDGAATETLRFSAPDGTALDPALHPQLMIFRLPPGQ